MQEIKKLGQNLLTSFIILIIGIIIISFLSYVNILGGKVLAVFKILISFIAIIVGSFKQGIKSTKRGFLEGLKIGLLFTIFYMLINLIFFKLFAIKNLLYYILILFVSMCGGMLGISKRKEEKK